MDASNTNSTGWIYDTSRPANEDRPYKAFIIWGVVFLIIVLFGYELTKQITVYAFSQLPIGSYIYTSEEFMDAVISIARLPIIFIPLMAAVTCLAIAKKPRKNMSNLGRLLVAVGFGTYALVRGWSRWQEVIASLPDPSINTSQIWIAIGMFSQIVGLVIAAIIGIFLGKLSCHFTMNHQEVTQ